MLQSVAMCRSASLCVVICRSASPCVAGVAGAAAAKIHKMALLSLSIFLRKLATNHRARLTKT